MRPFPSLGISGDPLPNILAVAGPNSTYAAEGARPASLLAGFWHGIICPITSFVSIFSSGVRIYEPNNSGVMSHLGFVIGIVGSFGGSGSQAM